MPLTPYLLLVICKGSVDNLFLIWLNLDSPNPSFNEAFAAVGVVYLILLSARHFSVLVLAFYLRIYQRSGRLMLSNALRKSKIIRIFLLDLALEEARMLCITRVKFL